ncbi:MAG: hypothetical protein RR588_03395 [Solibacillus sp.]
MNRQELLKNAKPILFNTGMVKAILDGKKSCTRRVVKLKDIQDVLNSSVRIESPNISDNQCIRCLCTAPYDAGDILYVRETFFKEDCTPSCEGQSDANECQFMRIGNYCYGYKEQYAGVAANLKWRPSIHMPKDAARIFLKVTDVRVERLQNITEEQAQKEGAPFMSTPWVAGKGDSYIQGFGYLWDEIYNPKHPVRYESDNTVFYGWKANPWVWVIKFERVTVDG